MQILMKEGLKMKVKKLLAGVISAAVVIGAMTVSAFAEDVADPD